jgi:hypothetical protein
MSTARQQKAQQFWAKHRLSKAEQIDAGAHELEDEVWPDLGQAAEMRAIAEAPAVDTPPQAAPPNGHAAVEAEAEPFVERSEPEQPMKEVWSKPLKQQSKAIQARWAGEQASEQDLRQYFLDLPLDKAFNLYAQMRKNLEVAGKILNDRSNVPEEQHCKTCYISFVDYQKRCRKNDWFLNRPYYHQGDRNIIDVDHFCSAACVSLENNKTQGVYGMPDRGMLASDNPRNHPRLAQQNEFPEQKPLTDGNSDPRPSKRRA